MTCVITVNAVSLSLPLISIEPVRPRRGQVSTLGYHTHRMRGGGRDFKKGKKNIIMIEMFNLFYKSGQKIENGFFLKYQ